MSDYIIHKLAAANVKRDKKREKEELSQVDINTKKWKQKLSVFLIVSMIMQTAGVTALAEEGSLVEEASKVITATSSNAKRHVQRPVMRILRQIVIGTKQKRTRLI